MRRDALSRKGQKTLEQGFDQNTNVTTEETVKNLYGSCQSGVPET